MSIVILKGANKNLECTLKQCVEINEMKMRGTDPKTSLIVSGTVVELGDIRYAIEEDTTDRELNREHKKTENSEELSKVIREFNAEIFRLAKGTLEGKLKFNLSVARFYCFAITGKPVEEYKDQLKPIFLEVLKTEKLIVNPTKYLKIFKVEDLRGDKDLTKMDYMIRKAPLRYMENYLMEVQTTLARAN